MSASSAVAPGSTRPGAPLEGASVASGVRDGILLVEDDEMVATLMKQVLERVHWRVWRAGDGAECERLVAEHGPAIAMALVDCGLPDVESAGLCERLRAALPGLPVLLTSGREHPDLVQMLAADGPADFLAKPFLPGDVLRRVQNLMTRAA